MINNSLLLHLIESEEKLGASSYAALTHTLRQKLKKRELSPAVITGGLDNIKKHLAAKK